MKQIGEYKLQFESFEDLKYFIKDGISYYGDQYCMSDIDTDEYLTNEYIEDDFLNYEDRIKRPNNILDRSLFCKTILYSINR